jgi:hypothetical protein
LHRYCRCATEAWRHRLLLLLHRTAWQVTQREGARRRKLARRTRTVDAHRTRVLNNKRGSGNMLCNMLHNNMWCSKKLYMMGSHQ